MTPDTPSAIERLQRHDEELFRRMSQIEKTLAALPYMSDDIKEARDNVREIRVWVEQREHARKREEIEKEKLSTQAKVAIIGGSAVIVASIVTAISTLLNAAH